MAVPDDLDYNFSYATLMNAGVKIGQEDVKFLLFQFCDTLCFIWSTVIHPDHVTYFFHYWKTGAEGIEFLHNMILSICLSAL